MLDTIDCAVLMVPAHDSWMRGWIDNDASRMRRFSFHSYPFADNDDPCISLGGNRTQDEAGVLALQHAAPNLRRFDLCVLPVTLATLGWSRTALACVQGNLATPILGLLVDIKAPAVSDLLALGMQDFLRFPACLEEFRVRALQLAERRSPRSRCSRMVPPQVIPHASNRSTGVHESHVRYGAARVQRTRPEAAMIARAVLELDAAPQLDAAEAFRTAKSRVVSSFEQDYLRLALQRHHGNVARAARASCKHRRAFWALMRKHGIDASVYRHAGEYDA